MNIDLSEMNDPDFLAERRRVRETIEVLQERYAQINDEFDRRAAAQWSLETQRKAETPCTTPTPSKLSSAT